MANGIWSRAVWLKGDTEKEGLIPTFWIKENSLMWPVGVFAIKAKKQQKNPDESWTKFRLLKVKLQSGVCSYNIV